LIFHKSPRSASEAERGQKKSMATASSAICHAPKLLTVIVFQSNNNDGLELCVQKGVVLLPAGATLVYDKIKRHQKMNKI